ncbi:MAG: hypothetical protein ACYDCM_07295 [Candidatus Acidiferrales bacterium]
MIETAEKPLCSACGQQVEDHIGPIDIEAEYFCNRQDCQADRRRLIRDIDVAFVDYERDFMKDESDAQEAESIAAAEADRAASEAHRNLAVVKGDALFRKLRREWPEATDTAICEVTREAARKPKPKTWAELLSHGRKTNGAKQATPEDSELVFVAFDSRLDHAVAPDGTDHISSASGFSRIVQDATGFDKYEATNAGITFIDTGDVSRKVELTPKWIRDLKIHEFIQRRMVKAVQLDRQDIAKAWDAGQALDYEILFEFYIGRHSDEQIFQDHEDDFQKERKLLGHNIRWTSSPVAVKHRRERLLRERDALYGVKSKPWTSASWRGVIVSYIASNEDGTRERRTAGFATRKRSEALKLAERFGYTGRFYGDRADLIEEEVFDSLDALKAWMQKHDLKEAK